MVELVIQISRLVLNRRRPLAYPQTAKGGRGHALAPPRRPRAANHTILLIREPQQRGLVGNCDGVVDSAFDDPTLVDFISDIIFEGGVDCYMEFDGDKYHKSNLVNNMLNSSTKLLSSDRNVRSMTKQSI